MALVGWKLLSDEQVAEQLKNDFERGKLKI
jgi:hypothetical protein